MQGKDNAAPSKSTITYINRFPDEFVSKVLVQFRHPPYVGEAPGQANCSIPLPFACFLPKTITFDFLQFFEIGYGIKNLKGKLFSGRYRFSLDTIRHHSKSNT